MAPKAEPPRDWRGLVAAPPPLKGGLGLDRLDLQVEQEQAKTRERQDDHRQMVAATAGYCHI